MIKITIKETFTTGNAEITEQRRPVVLIPPIIKRVVTYHKRTALTFVYTDISCTHPLRFQDELVYIIILMQSVYVNKITY